MPRGLRIGSSDWSRSEGTLFALPLQSAGPEDANLAGIWRPTPGLSAYTGVIPGGGQNASNPVIDPAVAPPGMSGSLRFDVKSETGAGAHGMWFTNYPPIWENQEIWIQWLEMDDAILRHTAFMSATALQKTVTGISNEAHATVTCPGHGYVNGGFVIIRTPEMPALHGKPAKLSNVTTDNFKLNDITTGVAISTLGMPTFGSGTVRSVFPPGMKNAIFTAGDTETKVWASCERNDIVVTDYAQKKFPVLYHSCGVYAGFYTLEGGQLKLQGEPACFYANHAATPAPNTPPGCWSTPANVWVVKEFYLKYGNWVQAEGKFNHCAVKYWEAEYGDAPTLLLDINDSTLVDVWNPTGQNNLKLNGSDAGINQVMGKIFLGPYMTTKTIDHIHPLGCRWDSSLIVDNKFIPFP